MTLQNFVDRSAPAIGASWLNQVDVLKESMVLVPALGPSTSATSAIQAIFNAAVIAGTVREIAFAPGTHLLTNPNSVSQGSAAVVIRGLKRCRIRGFPGTKFVVNATGVGDAEFGMFRLEESEDLEFCYFEMDGSGIVNTGANANRSASFLINSFEVNNPAADLLPNKRLEFHHLYVHDIGGGPNVLPRSAGLAPALMTEGLSVHDCEFKNLPNVNHGVTGCFVRNLSVRNNKFWQDIPSFSPVDSMAVDASRGCVNVDIENNWVYGFNYGIKHETQNNAGPSGTEQRPSRRTRIVNNRLEQIGHPTTFVVGGDNTFGIRANGVDALIEGNTVEARTIGTTTGGLYAAFVAANTHQEESHVIVQGNRAKGAQYGIIQNDATTATRECSVEIRGNRFVDCALYAASVSGNVTFDDNWVIRAGKSGVEIQGADLTFVRRNKFIDCASSDNAIIPERVAAVYQDTPGASSVVAGYTEILDNVVIDTRGGSAAEYAYFLRASNVFTNPLVFRPGHTAGMLTAVAYDSNFNVVGDTLMTGGVNRAEIRTFLVTGNPQTTAPWSGLTYGVGDTSILFPPVVGSNEGWRCVVAGTPGTHVPFGLLQLANVYSVVGPSTDRSLDVAGNTTAQVAAVLGTLITDLQAAGLLKV